MPDQVPARIDQSFVRIGNKLGLGQINEATIVLLQLAAFLRPQTPRMKKQVLLHFIANYFGQNQPADFRGTE